MNIDLVRASTKNKSNTKTLVKLQVQYQPEKVKF
jgi:hypothetical protein